MQRLRLLRSLPTRRRSPPCPAPTGSSSSPSTSRCSSPAACAPAPISHVPLPEWFFFFYEQMLMFFPGYALIGFGAVVIPTIFIVLLFALPWLDRGPHYSALKRPFVAVIGLLVVVTVVLNMLLAVSRIINFPGGE